MPPWQDNSPGDCGLLLPPHGHVLHYSLGATLSDLVVLQVRVGLVPFGRHVSVLRTYDFSVQTLASGSFVCPQVN